MKAAALYFTMAVALWVLGPAAARAEQARPCGPNCVPGPLRFLIPQGAGGGDFRQACRRHDVCYTKGVRGRAQCDQQFLNDMLAACRNAENPQRCQRVARKLYRNVRLFGGPFYWPGGEPRRGFHKDARVRRAWNVLTGR